VELLNQVDATYRSELREQNELNFARFDAKLEQRIAELRAELMQRLSELGEQLEKRLADRFEKRFELFEKRFENMDGRLDRIENRIDQQNRLFILAWVTLIATVVGMGLR